MIASSAQLIIDARGVYRDPRDNVLFQANTQTELDVAAVAASEAIPAAAAVLIPQQIGNGRISPRKLSPTRSRRGTDSTSFWAQAPGTPSVKASMPPDLMGSAGLAFEGLRGKRRGPYSM